MSRTPHHPSDTRLGHRAYRVGACPFLPEVDPAVRYRWMIDRVCTVSPRAHPGGACPEQPVGHPVVEVVDRSHRRDGTVRETRHVRTAVGWCSRLGTSAVAYIASRQERTARQDTRRGLRELTKAVNAGGGPLELDVCDDDELDVPAPRHRHGALWEAW